MEVFVAVGQTYTTISGGHLVNADLSRMIQNGTHCRPRLAAG